MASLGKQSGARVRGRAMAKALVGARARALMSIGIVLGLGAVGTMAAWNDSSTATSGAFTTGLIDIKLGNPAVDANPPAFATALTSPNLGPGTTVSAPLVVSNSGSIGFNYTIKVTATNQALGTLLNSSVYAAATCTGTASTVNSLAGTKTFPNLTRSVPVGGTDQLCISVTLPTTAVLPDPPVTGNIVYTFDAVSVAA